MEKKTKLFAIVFLLLLCTGTISQARTRIEKQYENKGTAIIHKGVVVNDILLMDNAFKQHIILKKANQWLMKKYDSQTIKIVDETIMVVNPECQLFLEFVDGGFTYTFSTEIKNSETNQQQIIDYLVQYIRTCKLENMSW